MHCLYNPSEEEFTDWVAAAERETWKHIPAIKSHIAEEITLDRCVQRLRKRLLAESWEKRRNDSTGAKMGERVPSFFVSPSLVNLSGLGVSDQANIEGVDQNQVKGAANVNVESSSIPAIDVKHGWAGMGLQGNRSSNSLELSSASGLFIEGDGPPVEQAPGEQTVNTSITQLPSTNSLNSEKNGYIKTTSMAHFYYRNTSSYSDLERSRSHGHVNDLKGGGHNRRKSKSFTELPSPRPFSLK
jgi:hypothetical protein